MPDREQSEQRAQTRRPGKHRARAEVYRLVDIADSAIFLALENRLPD